MIDSKKRKILAKRAPFRLNRHEMQFLKRLTLDCTAPFDFQVQIGFYIADFVFPCKMLVIELDGNSHDGREAYDKKRDAFLRSVGFEVWRIENEDAPTFRLERIREYQRVTDAPSFPIALGLAEQCRRRAVHYNNGGKKQDFKRTTEQYAAPLQANTERIERSRRARKIAFNSAPKLIKARG